MSALRTWRTVKPPCLCIFTFPPPPPPQPPFNQQDCYSYEHHIPYHITTATQLLKLNSPPTHLVYTAESPPSMAESNSSSVDQGLTEIIVVRHGETAWNADGRIQGHLDVELNEVGRQQAAMVADRISREFKVSVVYSSDLKRAFETAETIAASCGGVEVIKDQDLRERHLGELQGLVLREAAKVSTKAYQAFLSHKTNQDIPGGGESLDQLYQRCTSALQRIASMHRGERVIVVTHGGFIRALYKRACPNGKSGGKILNTSINILQLSDTHDWTIKAWNDVSHLNESGYLKSGFGGDRTSGNRANELIRAGWK